MKVKNLIVIMILLLTYSLPVSAEDLNKALAESSYDFFDAHEKFKSNGDISDQDVVNKKTRVFVIEASDIGSSNNSRGLSNVSEDLQEKLDLEESLENEIDDILGSL